MDLKLFALISVFLIYQGSCGPKQIYKIKKIECLINSKFVSEPLCFVKAINWNKAIAQMDCYILQPIRNVTVRLRVYKQDYNNQYQPFLIDVIFNMCNVLSKRNFSPYGVIIRKLCERYSNFNHSCPFVGHLMARDLYVDENLLPAFPLGFYQFSIFIMENHINDYDYIGEIKLFVHAMEMVQLNRRKPKKNVTKV
ncbi:uncharacterized protein LOC108658156 [Drosophila navojoa]|uniref:uncharacterized protein LOC108658156 n=1 Tax=Drosophila navojoa TaxID=7232 RepID=UPI0011BD7D0C|nr:uncharacterized protein LOC108658156 [Drosophila navojoa]